MVKNKENYGTMFASMSSRVVDIETTNSMGSDSFILTLRRLVTDNGTSFVAANIKRKGKHQKKSINERNHTKINWDYLETKSSYGKQYRRSLRVLNLFSLKYNQLIAENS